MTLLISRAKARQSLLAQLYFQGGTFQVDVICEQDARLKVEQIIAQIRYIFPIWDMIEELSADEGLPIVDCVIIFFLRGCLLI
jgi:hypothetical protein